MLCKLSLLLSIVTFAMATTGKKGCVSEGTRYKDGQRFIIGCTGTCTCSDGEKRCISMCPPIQFPPECHIVKKREDCCGQVECKSEMMSKTCDHGSTAGYNTINSPWSVKVKSGAEDNATKCLGTIVDENFIFVHESCIGQNGPITFDHVKLKTGSRPW